MTVRPFCQKPQSIYHLMRLLSSRRMADRPVMALLPHKADTQAKSQACAQIGWNRYQEDIRWLYLFEDLRLRDVMDPDAEGFGFVARYVRSSIPSSTDADHALAKNSTKHSWRFGEWSRTPRRRRCCHHTEGEQAQG